MIIDGQGEFSNKQAVTAAAASTNYINKTAKGDLGLGCPLFVCITVTTAAAAAGAATVAFQLQCDDNSSFSSPKTVIQTDAIGKAELVVGKQYFLPLPVGLDEKYVRLYYNVGTGPLTAGAFSAAIVHGIQKSVAYPDAI